MNVAPNLSCACASLFTSGPLADRRETHINENLASREEKTRAFIHQVALGLLRSSSELKIGAQLKTELLSDVIPQKQYGVGEFVGIQIPPSADYRLSFIQKVFQDGTLDCCGLDQTSFIHLHMKDVCQLHPSFLEYILYHLMGRKRLSLEGVMSPHERESAPLLGDKVSSLLVRRPEKGECFTKGELVAVPTIDASWMYARVRDVTSRSIICFGPQSCPTPFKVLQTFCKEAGEKEGVQLIEVPFEGVAKVMEYPSLPNTPQRSIRVDTGSISSVQLEGEARAEPVPSVFWLVHELESRPIELCHSLPYEESFHAYVAESGSRSDSFDDILLKRMMEVNNTQFKERIELLSSGGSFNEGVFQEHIVPSGTKMYVCGDLHGNVLGILAFLRFLQKEHFVDAQFRCVPGFCMVFLGDYVDRGSNSLEALTLLLALRMENPNSVFLLRGNHENADWSKHQDFGDERLRDFLYDNCMLARHCFESLPLALCIASSDAYQKGPQRQYVHFSHGLFPLSVDPVSRLQGRDSLSSVSKICSFSESWNFSEKVRESEGCALKTRFQNDVSAHNSFGYMISDISPSQRMFPLREGRIFSSEEIDLVRKASETRDKKVCLFVRGHQHHFKEHTVERKPRSAKVRKIVAITVPASIFHAGMSKIVQGLFMTVFPRVRDWRKELCTLEWESCTSKLIFEVAPVSKRAYE